MVITVTNLKQNFSDPQQLLIIIVRVLQHACVAACVSAWVCPCKWHVGVVGVGGIFWNRCIVAISSCLFVEANSTR